MNLILRYTLGTAASLLVAPIALNAQIFVSDDFSLRGSITDGDILEGTAAQFSSSGSPTYNSSNGTTITTMRYHVRGSDTLAVPNYNNNATVASNSIEVIDMPTTGPVRMEAVALPSGSWGAGVSGMFVGLTDSDTPGLQNNIGTGAEHVSARFITDGGGAGRVNLQTYDGVNEVDSFSPAGDAVTFNSSHEYLVALDYDFDTLNVVASLENLNTSESTSISTTLGDSVTLSYAQFDITGTDGTGTAANTSGFSSYAVAIPEPSTLALIGGAASLCFVLLRRKRG